MWQLFPFSFLEMSMHLVELSMVLIFTFLLSTFKLSTFKLHFELATVVFFFSDSRVANCGMNH